MDPGQPQNMTAISTTPIAAASPYAPQQEDIKALEQSKYLKVGKQKKKQAKNKPEKTAETLGGGKCG